jgi:hypothetical protein
VGAAELPCACPLDCLHDSCCQPLNAALPRHFLSAALSSLWTRLKQQQAASWGKTGARPPLPPAAGACRQRTLYATRCRFASRKAAGAALARQQASHGTVHGIVSQPPLFGGGARARPLSGLRST